MNSISLKKTKNNILQIHLKNLFNTLTKNTLISLPYKDFTIPFITECKPEGTISVVDVDELEVDIEPINEPTISSKEPEPEPEKEYEQTDTKFPGEGRTTRLVYKTCLIILMIFFSS